ncbi:MAG: TlpA family protein disulfide reductase [Candidatus Thorarchaeota archaeon]
METKQFIMVVLVLSLVVVGITGATLFMPPPVDNPTDTTTTSDSTTTTTTDDGVPDIIFRDQDLLPFNIAVPDWVFPMVDSGNYSISDAYGQFLILEFFATWCSACEYQNADNVKIYEAFPEEELEFLQVTTALGDSPQMLRDYITEHGLLWDLGYATDGIADEFLNIRYIPTLVLIDQTGTLRWIHEGTWRFTDFNATIVELMG